MPVKRKPAKRAAAKSKAAKPAKRTKTTRAKPFVKLHNDGTIWAKGQSINGVATGYWEWFRKTGTIMRSGYFEKGQQTGAWTTYDRAGRVYKVTQIMPKAKSPKWNLRAKPK